MVIYDWLKRCNVCKIIMVEIEFADIWLVHLLLNNHLIMIYLDLYVLGDDAWIS